MIFVGLIDPNMTVLDAELDSVVVFLFGFPMVVDDTDEGLGDYLVEINNEKDLAEWADRNFKEWEVR